MKLVDIGSGLEYLVCYIYSFYFCIVSDEPSWPWSHGSWIYDYLRNRYLSPLMLWVRLPLRAWCTTLCDEVCQWLAAGQWFSPSPPVSSTNKTWPPRYSWNLVESGLNHHKTNQNQPFSQTLLSRLNSNLSIDHTRKGLLIPFLSIMTYDYDIVLAFLSIYIGYIVNISFRK